jgi:hypothetical protein
LSSLWKGPASARQKRATPNATVKDFNLKQSASML